MNTISIEGRLTDDPEIKYFNGEQDSGIIIFDIAHNSPIKKNGVWTDEAHYFPCKIFVKGGQIKYYKNRLRKGGLIAIQGKLVQEKWKNAENQNRYKVSIQATDIVSFVPMES